MVTDISEESKIDEYPSWRVGPSDIRYSLLLFVRIPKNIYSPSSLKIFTYDNTKFQCIIFKLIRISLWEFKWAISIETRNNTWYINSYNIFAFEIKYVLWKLSVFVISSYKYCIKYFLFLDPLLFLIFRPYRFKSFTFS